MVEKTKKKFTIEDVLGSKGKIKILKVLAAKGESNISDVMRRARVNYSTIDNHMADLVEAGIVEETDFGRIRILRLRVEVPKVHAIKTMFEIWNASDLV